MALEEFVKAVVAFSSNLDRGDKCNIKTEGGIDIAHLQKLEFLHRLVFR